MKNITIGKKVKGWNCAEGDFNHESLLPYRDASVDNIAIIHALEHLTDSGILHLLRECYRVLKRRGYLRVIGANTTLYHHALMRDDREMFYNFIENCWFPSDVSKPHKATTDQLFLFTFAGNCSSLVGGSFKVVHEDKEYTDFQTLLDAVGQNVCYNLILQQNADLKSKYPVNWLSIGKLHQFLLQEINPQAGRGFPLVYISSYLQSSSPYLRNHDIDGTFPEGSLYIECMR